MYVTNKAHPRLICICLYVLPGFNRELNSLELAMALLAVTRELDSPGLGTALLAMTRELDSPGLGMALL